MYCLVYNNKLLVIDYAVSYVIPASPAKNKIPITSNLNFTESDEQNNMTRLEIAHTR